MLEVRRRINVSKTSTDKYSWEVTVEVTGSAPDWQAVRDATARLGEPEGEFVRDLLADTANHATDEIKRQIGAVKPE